MDKFIPKEKLSKKARREHPKPGARRGAASARLRAKPQNPKAYVREKPRIDGDDDTGTFL
jgi:hypothetical protein